MDELTYLEYLQSVLKKFTRSAAPLNDLFIQYFRDDLVPFIRAQFHKKTRNLYDWQEFNKQAIDSKARASC